jgi:hypothetical protein
MKLRILNYGVTATHERISNLNGFGDPLSVSDFDAFIYDSAALSAAGPSQQDARRRQAEVRDLIGSKGGIVVCILRPEAGNDWLLDRAAPDIANFVRSTIRQGAGSQFKMLPSARGMSMGYFQVLRGTLHFSAHLEASQSQIAQYGGTIFAVDSVGHPIAAEFPVGEGRVCMLPPPNNIPADRMGAAVVKVITAHFNKTAQVDAPAWAGEIIVPGASIHDKQIEELMKRMVELEVEVTALKEDRERLLSYVRLLFGYGKAVLEPLVRSAFRLLGFVVPEPEEYEGEWDVELRDNQSGRTALGEVEGSEGVIDVDKYRQLLDYIEAEAQEGRDHKGILIGNGFRLLALDAPERQNQFSEHARRGAARNQFCLVPTTELFKAVCAVLESPNDQALKATIRESLLATTGPWSFLREETTEEKSSTGQDHALHASTPSA